jgi:hypothetical protein
VVGILLRRGTNFSIHLKPFNDNASSFCDVVSHGVRKNTYRQDLLCVVPLPSFSPPRGGLVVLMTFAQTPRLLASSSETPSFTALGQSASLQEP